MKSKYPFRFHQSYDKKIITSDRNTTAVNFRLDLELKISRFEPDPDNCQCCQFEKVTTKPSFEFPSAITVARGGVVSFVFSQNRLKVKAKNPLYTKDEVNFIGYNRRTKLLSHIVTF